jgi:phenylalanyl-tRNA synthetase beta chain
MNTSVRWINEYLDRPASASEQAEALTRAGFPIEHSDEVLASEVEGGDVRQDVELTSNRGDCLCHVGLAREIAAITGRALKPPHVALKATGPAASTMIKVTNREPGLCPLYTARVIRGVRVGPSPRWLADRLRGRGDIPRNNIVDASNFVLFELGQPTHVFDLATVRGPEIIIRMARSQEPFLPIGEGAAEVKLSEHDLVIADAERAVAIAGVKGGALTAVTNATKDILIEAATFAPATVRSTSRRLGIASDSSYRFERGVHPGQVNAAADRLASLILDLCGGELCDGIVSDGVPIPPQRTASMRCARCRAILGLDLSDDEIVKALDRLGLQPNYAGGSVSCTIPYSRMDLEREIDLIEEVGRMAGTDRIAIADMLRIRVAPPQPTELAARAVNDALVGMGYIETVTHTLISDAAAEAFLPPNMTLLRVADERATAEPALRPSVLPSLLRVFAHNRDKGVHDVKLFETASTFAEHQGRHLETVNLALLAPTDDVSGVRSIRGAVDQLVRIVLGRETTLAVEPIRAVKWLQHGAVLSVKNRVLGTLGILDMKVAAIFGISDRLLVAELGLPAYYREYPPLALARELPAFPGIDRDVSAIVDDRLPWSDVKTALEVLEMQHVETIEFVTTYRGKQIGTGKKSLTLRAHFRAPDRTLTHEEVDPQVEMLIDALKSKFHAEIRS